VSNLTFGAIQLELAQLRGLDPATILALQSVGAALGNMVCIHNIVAVCSILGLQHAEGAILRRNTPPLLIYAIIVALASFLLFPG
jgi:lactate permease